MNPLNSITGTIIAGFVLAIILGFTAKMVMKSGSGKTPATTTQQAKPK